MATEGDALSQAGSSAGDLKALVKDSIRELLQEEPSLLTSTPRGPLEGGTAHGDVLGAMPDAAVVQQLGLPVTEEVPPTGGGPVGVLPGGQHSTSGSATPSPDTKATGKPFILSEGLPPVPHKLMSRILKGEFIDMAELLRDNLEAQRRASAVAQQGIAATSNAKSRREIPDLVSWIQCFGTYIAVITSKFPHRIKELLAYQTLIVREARQCGGKGWLAYDSHFRQQVVGNESADWSRLNQSLYAVTFITQGDRDKSKSCGVCLESDRGTVRPVLPSNKGSCYIKADGVRPWIQGVARLPDMEPGKGGGQTGVFRLEPGRLPLPGMGIYVSVAPATTASLVVLGCGPRLRGRRSHASPGAATWQTSAEGVYSSVSAEEGRWPPQARE